MFTSELIFTNMQEKTKLQKVMIVVSSEMEYLPFLVIYSTSSLVLPAYFNLLTLFNQTYKRRALS